MQTFRKIETPPRQPITIESKPAGDIDSRPPASAGMSPMQLLGMDPAVVIAAIILDCMMSALDWMTLGVFTFFSFIAAIGFSIYSFHIQHEKFGDSRGIAFGKSALLFVLIMLPTPIGGFLAIPSGIAGFFRNTLNK